MRDRVFGWDFPPGVTGNEPEIVGYPAVRCVCGHLDEDHSDEDKPACLHPDCSCEGFREEVVYPDTERG